MLWISGQGPTMELSFYVRKLKSMPMVIMLADGIVYFGHHVNMQLIKIPTTSYVNATLKRWGDDFTRNM